MTSKAKKAGAAGGKGKKGQGFGKDRAAAGGGPASPLATFEDDDMYQEPIKKVNGMLDIIPPNRIPCLPTGMSWVCGAVVLRVV